MKLEGQRPMDLMHRSAPALSAIVASSVAVFVQLGVPRFLTPAEFSEFSLVWGAGQLASLVFFEWLRLSTIQQTGLNHSAPGESQHLFFAYTAVSFILLLICFALIAANRFYGAGIAVAVALFYGLSQGWFDGIQAWHRANSRNIRFATLNLARAALSLFLALLAALIFRNWIAVVLFLSLSFLIPSFFMLPFRSVRDLKFNVRQLKKAATSGVGLTISAASTLSIILFSKWSIAFVEGKETSAGYFLALDLAIRASMVIVGALNIVSLQSALMASNSPKAESGYLCHEQILKTAFGCAAAAVFFCSLHPLFSDVLVSPQYQREYNDFLLPSLVVAALAALRIFGIDSAFMIEGRGKDSFRSALLGLLSTLFIFSTLFLSGISSSATSSTISLVAGLTFSIIFGIIDLRFKLAPFLIFNFIYLVAISIISIALPRSFMQPSGGVQQVILLALSATLFFFGVKAARVLSRMRHF